MCAKMTTKNTVVPCKGGHFFCCLFKPWDVFTPASASRHPLYPHSYLITPFQSKPKHPLFGCLPKTRRCADRHMQAPRSLHQPPSPSTSASLLRPPDHSPSSHLSALAGVMAAPATCIDPPRRRSETCWNTPLRVCPLGSAATV